MTDAFSSIEDAVYKEIGTAIARGAVKVVSASGRIVSTYFTPQVQQHSKILSEMTYPPMIVVGLGRCGSFVTGQLVAMLGKVEPSAEASNSAVGGAQSGTDVIRSPSIVPRKVDAPQRFPEFIRTFGGFFGAADRPEGPVFAVEPKMFMGDIDETIFRDVVLSLSKTDENLASRLLQISYEPLAYGGVGNTPIFSEFLTRGLLLLPPAKIEERENPWTTARTMLLDGYSTHGQRLRLAFYIFSASGGTGSGAASELLRAQRYALAGSGVPHQVYFCGIAVLPRANLLKNNQTHQRNAGRLLIQYLSELNIFLPNPLSFHTAPEFLYDVQIQLDHSLSQASTSNNTKVGHPGSQGMVDNAVNLVPWDALLFVSNDVMPVGAGGGSGAGFEEADIEANKYIAQCMFNISSAQLPIAQIKDRRTERTVPETINYQSRRLDPNDLRTGLTGPICVGFAAMSVADTRSDDRWVERLFSATLALPNRRNSEKAEHESAVQGISVSPEPTVAYQEKISQLGQAIQSGDQQQVLAALRVLSEVRLFKHCPRAVLVFTSPQTGEIPANIEDRFDQLITELCPNLVQLRTAIVRGTTTIYTATILFEASVINVPDVMSSFVNYLWYSFAKPELTIEQFKDSILKILRANDEKIVADEDLSSILIDREDSSRTVPNYRNQVTTWERNWEIFKEKQREARPDSVSKSADQHKIDNFVVSRTQVVAAFNYIKYARSFEKRSAIPIDEFL